MSLDFNDKDDSEPNDPNIDSSLTLNPPASLTSPFDSPTATPGLPSLESTQVITDPSSSFGILTQEPSTATLTQEPDTQGQQSPPPQPLQQAYTPAKLFQATGDVRNLSRSDTATSGFTVHIYDRHTRIWVPDINYLDIAVRGQLYILWKTAYFEQSIPLNAVDRDVIFDAAALTLCEIQKDNNKWERNYSAARRRDWHPHFTTFYDDIFKGVWTQRIWPAPGSLPEPPRFLAEMARKLTKNAGSGAGTNIHQPVHSVVGELEGELSMSPVALRTLKLRVIELEGMNQGLREELLRSEEARALLLQENTELKSRFEEIRQKLNIS